MGTGCAATPKTRWIRGVGAVAFAAMAFTVGNSLLAIIFGLLSLSLLTGAVTGKCPAELWRPRQVRPGENSGENPAEIMGYPVAVQDLRGKTRVGSNSAGSGRSGS